MDRLLSLTPKTKARMDRLLSAPAIEAALDQSEAEFAAAWANKKLPPGALQLPGYLREARPAKKRGGRSPHKGSKLVCRARCPGVQYDTCGHWILNGRSKVGRVGGRRPPRKKITT